MELQAAIEALAALTEPCEVEFFTDSEYVNLADEREVIRRQAREPCVGRKAANQIAEM